MTEPKTDIFDKIRAEIETEIGTKQWEDYDYCSGLIRAKNIINKALKDVERWIPVSERLPEKNVWVLVYCKDGSEWEDVMKIHKYGNYWTNDIDTYENEVIAWMPLPKPYEVEPQESEKINCKSTKCENCINHNYCDYEPQKSEG